MLGIIGEMRLARRHPVAALIGFGMGGYVPVQSFTLMHDAGALSFWQRGLVAACLVYSSLSVWQWARIALASPYKAAAFVVLLEGGMVVSGVPFLSCAALAYLVFINATHTAAIVAARDLELCGESLKAAESVPGVLSADAEVAVHQRRSQPRVVLPRSPRLMARAGLTEEAELYEQARRYVLGSRNCSVSGLKKQLRLGHSKAARLVERLERDGIVGPANAAGLRSVLVAAA